MSRGNLTPYSKICIIYFTPFTQSLYYVILFNTPTLIVQVFSFRYTSDMGRKCEQSPTVHTTVPDSEHVTYWLQHEIIISFNN